MLLIQEDKQELGNREGNTESLTHPTPPTLPCPMIEAVMKNADDSDDADGVDKEE